MGECDPAARYSGQRTADADTLQAELEYVNEVIVYMPQPSVPMKLQEQQADLDMDLRNSQVNKHSWYTYTQTAG